VCEHCREAICCQCRREHYRDFCKYICLKLNQTQQETEKLIVKQGNLNSDANRQRANAYECF